MSDLRYPVGKFRMPEHISAEERHQHISNIEKLPSSLRAAVTGLSASQLDTPYRPDGWTIRQVLHHVPDSHLNAYIRVKLALTEDSPLIKTYMEDRWAELGDVRQTPIETSLSLLEALHIRWVLLLRSLTPEQWTRTLRHPELGAMTLEQLLALYSWHGRHHVAHITSLRERMGWQSH